MKYVLSAGILLMVFGANLAQALPIDTCLAKADTISYRLDRLEALRACFNSHKAELNRESCNQIINTKIKQQYSIKLTQDLQNFCFYEMAKTKNLKSCLREAHHIQSANDHDEAVFYCYQEFQDNMSRENCMMTSKQFVFPAKSDYLKQHCEDIEN